ncbi:MAG: hypothetical protein RR505_02825 [Raoultibacter sp.]
MEEKQYVIATKKGGRLRTTTLLLGYEDAKKQFWIDTNRMISRISDSEYGEDMEFCRPSEVSHSLYSNGTLLLSVTISLGDSSE